MLNNDDSKRTIVQLVRREEVDDNAEDASK